MSFSNDEREAKSKMNTMLSGQPIPSPPFARPVSFSKISPSLPQSYVTMSPAIQATQPSYYNNKIPIHPFNS